MKNSELINQFLDEMQIYSAVITKFKPLNGDVYILEFIYKNKKFYLSEDTIFSERHKYIVNFTWGWRMLAEMDKYVNKLLKDKKDRKSDVKRTSKVLFKEIENEIDSIKKKKEYKHIGYVRIPNGCRIYNDTSKFYDIDFMIGKSTFEIFLTNDAGGSRCRTSVFSIELSDPNFDHVALVRKALKSFYDLSFLKERFISVYKL